MLCTNLHKNITYKPIHKCNIQTYKILLNNLHINVTCELKYIHKFYI